MLRNKLVRSDGSIIDSSVIISCEFTEEVNSNTNLSVGDATASELTVEILASDIIRQGEVFTYYVIGDGVETKIGVFNAEKPTVATRTTMRFSAYDNIVKTAKVFSDWLRENQNLFPMTLLELVQYACAHSGVTLATTDFPHAAMTVNKFYADDLTCRQILAWAGAIAGRFIRANADGKIEFAWYRDATNIVIKPSKSDPVDLTVIDDGEGNISIESTDITVTDDGGGNVSMTSNNLALMMGDTNVTVANYQYIPYFQGALSYENYATDTIERVQINHSADDVGVIYPADIDGNCFTVSENMILGASDTATVTLIATDLYEQLKEISYVPCSVTIPRSIKVRAGDIITVFNSKGDAFVSYVMKVGISSRGTTLTSTGDRSYESNAAVSSEKYSNLTGKILSIKKSLDGLEIKNEDLAGKVSLIQVTVDGIDSYVGGKIKDAIDTHDATIGTNLSQTESGWNYQFGLVKGDLEGLSDEVKKQLEERKANIRFEDGNIILGRATSEIMLILKNNRISFVRNVVDHPEVAYISDDTLYITEGEFLTQMRIGKFGFAPGANGNLSFRKVVT
jgi:hypothetical protein